MAYAFTDYNGAETLFRGRGEPAKRWRELAAVLDSLPVYLQGSDQDRKVGTPIFDPKATNAHLTVASKAVGWCPIAVPPALTMFGDDWDAGKGSVLAEWQFSNYPFLWNNIIRTEAVFQGKVALEGMSPVAGLVVVTKSGMFPSSNSTLYYEQAAAQINAVSTLRAFQVPIRLVGITLAIECVEVDAVWTKYPGRYARQKGIVTNALFSVTWGKAGKYGGQPARLLRKELPAQPNKVGASGTALRTRPPLKSSSGRSFPRKSAAKQASS